MTRENVFLKAFGKMYFQTLGWKGQVLFVNATNDDFFGKPKLIHFPYIYFLGRNFSTPQSIYFRE